MFMLAFFLRHCDVPSVQMTQAGGERAWKKQRVVMILVKQVAECLLEVLLESVFDVFVD